MTPTLHDTLTLGITLAFCVVHVFIRRLNFLDRTPRSRWLSFAGGVAVAYVFIHILPELGAHANALREATAMGDKLAEIAAYGVGLAGLSLFYGIERIVVASKGEGDADETRADRELFWLHLVANSVLAATITYLLARRVDDEALAVVIYGIAVVLHFLSADFGSHKHHPKLYDRGGRWVLSAATLAGWGAALAVDLPEVWVGGLIAFVGGGIILVTLKEELPAQRESRFLPFLFGAVLYTALIAAQKVLA